MDVIAERLTFRQVILFIDLEEAHIVRIVQTTQSLATITELAERTLAERDFKRERGANTTSFRLGRN